MFVGVIPSHHQRFQKVATKKSTLIGAVVRDRVFDLFLRELERFSFSTNIYSLCDINIAFQKLQNRGFDRKLETEPHALIREIILLQFLHVRRFWNRKGYVSIFDQKRTPSCLRLHSERVIGFSSCLDSVLEKWSTSKELDMSLSRFYTHGTKSCWWEKCLTQIITKWDHDSLLHHGAEQLRNHERGNVSIRERE